MKRIGRTAVMVLALLAAPNAHARQRYDVIDMHFHADRPDAEGPPGGKICAPYSTWAPRDPGQPIDRYLDWFTAHPTCPRALIAPTDATTLRDRGLAMLDRYNALALAGGDAATVEDYRAHAPVASCPRRGSATMATCRRSRH